MIKKVRDRERTIGREDRFQFDPFQFPPRCALFGYVFREISILIVTGEVAALSDSGKEKKTDCDWKAFLKQLKVFLGFG